MIDAWIDTEKMPHLPKCICGGCAVIHRGKTGCFIGCERAGDPDPSVRHVCSTAVFTDEALAGEEWNYLCDMESQEGCMKPKSEWSIRESLDFANTLANHGWTREANADVASSCIYALCRMLKERGNSAAMREALELCRRVIHCAIIANILRGDDAYDALDKATSALSAPPRNCDRFVTQPEMSRAYEEYRKSAMKSYGNGLTGGVPTVKQKPMTYDEWMLAPADERKGECDD